MLAALVFAVGMMAERDQASIARAKEFVARGDFDAALRAAGNADPFASEQIRGAVAEARDSLRDAAEHYAQLDIATGDGGRDERHGADPWLRLGQRHGDQRRLVLLHAVGLSPPRSSS